MNAKKKEVAGFQEEFAHFFPSALIRPDLRFARVLGFVSLGAAGEFFLFADRGR